MDKRTRVQTVDLSEIETSGECRTALETILRLSLPTNRKMQSARVDPDNLLLVRAPAAEICLDERDVPAAGTRIPQALPVSRKIEPPVLRDRLDPVFPDSGHAALRSENTRNVVIIAEALITREGCVRDVRLLTQSTASEFNRAVVLALSQWKFHPGKLDGVPVDVIFNLTVNFTSR